MIFLFQNRDLSVSCEWLVTQSQNIISWARSGSIWPITFGLACCAIEMMHVTMSRYDMDRFGIIFRPSPRHADFFLISGTVTIKMINIVNLLYAQMMSPKWILSMGSCANRGGLYYYSYSVVTGLDLFLTIDYYVPGCPPSAEALLFGLIQLQGSVYKHFLDYNKFLV